MTTNMSRSRRKEQESRKGRVRGKYCCPDVVVSQPSQKDLPAHSNVGLEELSKTDRLLVQQVRVASVTRHHGGQGGQKLPDVHG